MSEPAKISQRKLAKHWGCSQPYVAQCIKKGCPLDSLEAADKWRLQNVQRGAGYRSKGKLITPEPPEPVEVPEAPTGPAVDAPAPPPPPPPESIPAGTLATLQESLAACIEVERAAYDMVLKAQRDTLADPLLAATLPVLISSYSNANANRMRAEKMVKALERENQITITMAEAQEICVRAWAPLVTRLRSIAKRAGIKANPVDDVLAEAVISAEIEDALKEAQKVFAFPDVVAA